MKRYTIRVPEEDWVEWQEAAQCQRCDVSDIVRKAVNAELNRHKPRIPSEIEKRIAALEGSMQCLLRAFHIPDA